MVSVLKARGSEEEHDSIKAPFQLIPAERCIYLHCEM